MLKSYVPPNRIGRHHNPHKHKHAQRSPRMPILRQHQLKILEFLSVFLSTIQAMKAHQQNILILERQSGTTDSISVANRCRGVFWGKLKLQRDGMCQKKTFFF